MAVAADQPIIELEGVTKVFGSKAAVLDVTARVPWGRCYAWLGPNGSGKTTLIRMMLGLARPTRGRIKVRGYEIPAERRPALARVGAVVEEPRFYPYLSGRRNLEIFAAHFGPAAGSRVDAVLDRVGLAKRAKDRVRTYSLGMRQRLGVARALLNDPELLVLDEPMNGLDPAGMVEFRTMIRSLVDDEHRTVFISSHLLDEVERLADDVAIVQAGRLVSLVSMSELVRTGHGWFVLDTDDPAAATTVLNEVRLVRTIERADPAAGAQRLRIEATDLSDDTALVLTRTLAERGVGVVEFVRHRPSLETRFLELTAGSEVGAMADVPEVRHGRR